MVRDRALKCVDNNGGANELYLFPYSKIRERDIKVVDNILIDFPTTLFYKIEALNITYSIDASDYVYNEKVSFNLSKLNPLDDFSYVLKRDYRVIIKDNNGYYRLLGLRTGLVGKYKEDISVNRVDSNNYSFDFETREINIAPYLKNLDFFKLEADFFLEDGIGNIITDGLNNNITTL